ncbi:succinate dehydrogenase, hydrophobic membrane anchor protein [Candidatus Pantoea edessiphila]|uniref:Succinate dehydrogenase hydrophobic membrane anchor subunit n=1 Tax=Candidatus Pantoea edessiphila TaxID=2044610 RepID=A0A2P5T2A7_9GAMM|nr:succinate dehydrogenase, hydrophobic membrane anchor protein [Candidatus Pantoea edessiphila]PPI88725.1 succinate dehydrogenase, hydrophobic membrane anchor protein [Candidatus Pantoea edessiphila]
MVSYPSALSRNGAIDWFILRITAIVIVIYAIYLCCFFINVDKLDYYTWHKFFENIITKTLTMLVIFSVLIHGWIGIWQVLTDYVKLAFVRLILQSIIILFLISYAIFGFIVVCGG